MADVARPPGRRPIRRVQEARAALARAVASERAAQAEVPMTRDTAGSRIHQAGAAAQAARVAVEVVRAQIVDGEALPAVEAG